MTVCGEEAPAKSSKAARNVLWHRDRYRTVVQACSKLASYSYLSAIARPGFCEVGVYVALANGSLNDTYLIVK